MSEAELWELFFQASSAVGMGSTVFLTVVSAYVAAAYFVGARLGRYQVAFVSMLFVLFAAFAERGKIRTIVGSEMMQGPKLR
jgi:hypothetical protein